MGFECELEILRDFHRESQEKKLVKSPPKEAEQSPTKEIQPCVCCAHKPVDTDIMDSKHGNTYNAELHLFPLLSRSR